VINSNLDPISHRLATLHSWHTDKRTSVADGTSHHGRLQRSCGASKITLGWQSKVFFLRL